MILIVLLSNNFIMMSKSFFGFMGELGVLIELF